MGILTDVFLPIALAFIMFSMGLALVVEDFKRIVLQPKAFAVGLVTQMVLLPVVALALASVWPIEPVLAVGIMILAACPSGVTSNLLTHLAKGDTALAVSLTAVNSVAHVVTIPFVVNLALAIFMGKTETVPLSVGGTILSVFLITTVPVAIGMAVRHRAAGFADRFEPIARGIATVLFIAIVLGAIAAERANLGRYFSESGPIALTLNVIMMSVGFYAARLFSLNRRQGIAIAIESGVQNSTLAIFVATTLLGDTRLAIPGAIYGLLMFVTAGAFVFAMRSRAAKAA